MKIAIILSSSSQPSGKFYNRQEIGLSKALMAQGVSSDIFVYSSSAKEVEITESWELQGLAVSLYSYPGLKLPGQQVVSYKLIRFLHNKVAAYDLFQVHDSTQVQAVLVAILSKTKKIPIILCQGMYRDFEGLIKKTVQKIYDLIATRYLLLNINAVICKTSCALEYLRSKGLKHSVFSEVIGVGIDPGVFLNSNTNIVKSIGLNVPQQIDVLYVGKIEKRRNSFFLAQLINSLISRRNDLKVLIVGTGSDVRFLLRELSQFAKKHNVYYIEKLENKYLGEIYKKSKIVLLPTKYEIFGMVLLEAMYFGIPAVASSEAGPREIISNGVDGIILNNFILEDWIDAAMLLISNDEIRFKMGTHAKDKILKSYLWDHLAPKFKSIYMQTLNNENSANQ